MFVVIQISLYKPLNRNLTLGSIQHIGGSLLEK